METNNQNNIENNVQETTGTYKDLEKTDAPRKEKRLGVWGSMWGILTDQVELIAYIDERIDTRASALIDKKVVAIANADIDEAFKQNVVEENTVNTTNSDETITFHSIDTSKAYELWFDTSDGQQATVKSSLISGTDITYTVNTPTVGTKFRLLVKGI